MTDITSHSQSMHAAGDLPILVAIDFSNDSKAALRWACNYADLSGTRLVLLHIVHDHASSPGYYKPANEKQLKPMQETAEIMMAAFLEEVKTDTPGLAALDSAEIQFIKGLPPTRIVEVSELLKAGLVVMGSRGITGLPHKLLGSVAERVTELSKAPVVVVKAEDTAEPGKKEIKRQKKQQKKDRRWLKAMLGLGEKPETKENGNG